MTSPRPFCPRCRRAQDAAARFCGHCGASRSEEGWPADPLVGRVLDGKYRIDERIAAGGFGAVFLATHVHGDRELGRVVIKFLHGELALDLSLVDRFILEAKAARELLSPHVVRIFDLGFTHEDVPFMVQEYVVGEGLDAMLAREGRLPPARVVRIGTQIAGAMLEAHEKGILHRDLKPANVKIQPTPQGDFAKILDFGVARIGPSRSDSTLGITGTPRYMPPEMLSGAAVDGRLDVFALGVILYELLAGEPPILAASEMEYLHRNVTDAPRDLWSLRRDLPEPLARIVMNMMTKDPAARPTMAGVCGALAAFGPASERASSPPPPPAPGSTPESAPDTVRASRTPMAQWDLPDSMAAAQPKPVLTPVPAPQHAALAQPDSSPPLARRASSRAIHAISSPLARHAVELRLVTPKQAEEALAFARERSCRLSAAFLSLRLLSDSDLCHALADVSGLPKIDLMGMQIPARVLRTIPRSVMEKVGLVPFDLSETKRGRFLSVAFWDPDCLASRAQIEEGAQATMRPYLARVSAIKAMLRRVLHREDVPVPPLPPIRRPSSFELSEMDDEMEIVRGGQWVAPDEET